MQSKYYDTSIQGRDIEGTKEYWLYEELTKCEIIEMLAHREHSTIAKAAAARRKEYNNKKEESAF